MSVFTGLIGVFVFGRNTFPLVITVLSGYVAYSRNRALKLKSTKIQGKDVIAAICTMVVLSYFLSYFQVIGMMWAPIIIYSTIDALIFVVVYDFYKVLIPLRVYKKYRIWLYEHIYKMTSVFAVLLSAFSGTVFSQYQPYSQFLPSVLGIVIIIVFMIYFSK